ncbi:HdeD family acid-resistance protein [Frankia nepalensis]|nr:DUF308 domain-containing protein [Frankia nepalensis]
MVRGAIAVIFGIFAIAWPGITLSAVVILFAIYAFCDAFGQFHRVAATDRTGSAVGHMTLGLIDIAAGIVALAWPAITAFVLTVWIAAWAVVAGIIEIAGAITSKRARTGVRISLTLLGVASILFGIVLFAHPYAGVTVLALLFGLFLLFYGVNLLVTGFRMRTEIGTGGLPTDTLGWRGAGRGADATRQAGRPASGSR